MGKKKVNNEGLTVTQEENFPTWYQQVITKSEMIHYYDVSGCYILRPWSFSIWERIQSFLDQKLKDDGVQNCYFPLFVSQDRLETEKNHVEGFAPEVAWVTRSGKTDLEKPIAVRPTSETAMYPAYADWIRSHRDLPLRLNQWCNVVRWEFQNPQPFLRTREFLWQEGHSAFAEKEEADKEVLRILDYYAAVYEELMAVPVIKGRKTEREKFAGGDYTTTVEAYISATGRGIQGATSHHLGQNFSKMFGIQYEHETSGNRDFVYQNSWGLTTRTIGVMIMVHGDNKGLVLTPRLAPTQVVVVPLIFKGKQTMAEMSKHAHEVADKLKEAGIRVVVDDREDKNPGWKYNHWELKGVPLRVELGPRDLENKCVMVCRRDTGAKESLKMDGIGESVNKLLETVQSEMFERAQKHRMSMVATTTEWDNFVSLLDQKKQVLAPFCEEIECENNLKKRSGEEAKEIDSQSGLTGAAKSLCIPFDQSLAGQELPEKCFCCGGKAKSWTLFGRSY